MTMQQTPLSLPVFSTINIQTIAAQLDEILTSSREKISVLQHEPAPTWESFAIPMQALDMAIEDFWSPISHLNGVKNSDELREVYQRCIEQLTQYSAEMGQNKDLFNAYQRLAAAPEYQQYSPAQKAWVQKALREFTLSGIDLSPEKQERYKAIQSELAALSQQFSNHVLDATAAWHKLITQESELAGLPAAMLAMLKQMAQAKAMDGYLITLDAPIYMAIMMHADNRALREELYRAYMSKASDQGPHAGKFDNSQVMVDILQLKQESAKMLGYASYAERSLVTKMAKNPAEVNTFLNELLVKAMPFAEQEMTILQSYAETSLGIKQIQSWDFAYASEKYRLEHFALSDELLRDYFPLETVLEGLFAIVGKLFGIDIKRLLEVDVYHDDVRFYEIHQNHHVIAGFYVDLFSRDKKRGGAWMADCRSRWQKTSGAEELPVAFLTANFRPATADKPALLSHGEVTTLFHEFGHGLHHMLTTQIVAGVSGIAGVEWDAVELPSQFLENWCWQEASLRLMSAHYQTGEPLPHALLTSLLNAKNFNAGLMMLRQVEFALFDMQIHADTGIKTAQAIQTHLDSVRAKTALIMPPSDNRFQHAFGHIFAGGYAAGYYSYKWAEVLSADAFARFEEEGLLSAAVGKAFLTNILQVGSSRPAAESFKAFRGREPDSTALLRHSGLIGVVV